MTVIFTDDFNRTVGAGLGTSPDTTEWSNVVNDDATVVPAAGGNPGYASNLQDTFARYQGLPLIQDGTITFDFWVPHDRSDGDIAYRVDGQDVLVSPPNHRVFLTVQIFANGDGASYFITTGSGIAYSKNVSRDTWYRCKYNIDVADATGHERIKVWKAALSEPGTWDATAPVVVFTRAALSPFQIGFRFSGGVAGDSTTEARFTNLIVETDHVDTVIWDPSSPHFGPPAVGPHDVPCAVKIEVDGVDVTALVEVGSAQFESAASGQVGTCEFWVKDLEQASSFVTGKEITLKLDSIVQWRGFVASVGRKYAFDVVRVDGAHPELTPRFLVVRGNDINILLSKRFVYNKADPTKHTPIFPQHTPDNSAVLTLGSSYLDLSGDGISTSGVTHVGDIGPDGKSYVIVPGMAWGEAMAAIAQLPGALFYIDPDKVLRYVNVDVVTADWGVSDTPVTGGPTAAVGPYGYREIVILKDGTALATDALVWGAGLGSSDMHFARYTAAPFESTHGKWQWADFREDLYKEPSLLKRATSYVAGNSGSGRGHQDDAVGVEFVLFKRGLRVGQVVSVQCLTFQFNMDLPIRRMRINFVGAQRQSDGSHKWFVRFWVNASHVIDDPWSNAEYPVPLNYRKEPNCQFVPMVDSCTGDGWTGSFYDPMDRSWTLAGPWGDGGCGAWGHESHTGSTGTEWVSAGPGPWCVVVYAGATITFADGSFIDDANRPEAMNSSWSVSATPVGVLSGLGASVDLGWGSAVPFFLRIQKTARFLNAKLWRASEPEPEHWTASSERNTANMVPGFIALSGGGPIGMGGDLRLTTGAHPGAISVATQAGWGWVYYIDAFTSFPPDYVSTYPPYNWQSRFFPAGTFPVNPAIVGSTQPIDAACTSNGAPLFARGDSGAHVAAGTDPHRMLYNLHWAWNSDNPDFSVNGTSQADGRMISRNHFYYGFLAPRGATTVTVHARVFISAPETGVFGLGGQPAPSGEGAIDWELWDVDAPVYDGTGSDTADPSRTLMGSGTLADYTYYTDTPTNFADITYSRGISEGDIFQIGGKITNSDTDLITTHGPADSFPANSGGRRVLELKLASMDIRFDWEPTACGPAEPNVAGYSQLPVNCKTGNPFCEVPKFKLDSAHRYETLHGYVTASTQLYLDGKRQTINVDYVEADPTNGQFDFLGGDGDLSERMSICYEIRDHQIFTLPKADPHFNKHPGYVGSPEDYHPKHVEQLGWHTHLDGSNCTCASAAVYLDAVTYGAQTATPPEIRAAQSDQSGGISLSDAAVALATYGVTLHVHSGSFSSFDAALDAGPVMMAGLYGQIPVPYNSDLPFTGGHSMMALCWSTSKKAILVYDPLNTGPIWMPTQVVRNYMEAFGGGSCDYGATV